MSTDIEITPVPGLPPGTALFGDFRPRGEEEVLLRSTLSPSDWIIYLAERGRVWVVKGLGG